MKYLPQNVTMLFDINLNDQLRVSMVRNDRGNNMAQWSLTRVICNIAGKKVELLDKPIELGQYDLWSLDWLIEEKILPIVKGMCADAFGPFMNEGAF